MRDTPEIAAARIEAERARGNMIATAHELQDRISPKTLAKDAWEGAKNKGADFAEDAVDAVRARPVAATGVVAAVTLFLAREPLMDLASKLFDSVSSREPKRRAAKKKTNAKQEDTETVE